MKASISTYCVLIAMLFATGNVVAQSYSPAISHSAFSRGLLNHLTNNTTSNKKNKAAKTTIVEERLKAQSDYLFSGMTIDSNTYTETDSAFYGYSSDRSSYFNYSTMAYYNAYQIDGADIFGFGSAIGFLDHNDNPTTLSDTTMVWQLNSFTFSLDYYDTRYAIYDTNNNILNYADYYADSMLHTDNRYVNTFDGYNNIVTSMAFNQDTTSWDTSEFRIFMYDGSHRLIEDSTNAYVGGVWSPKEKYFYSYDGSGNLVTASYYVYDAGTSSWTESLNYVMTYYSDSRIKQFTESQYIVSWNPVVSDSFGYTTGTSYATTWNVNTYNFDGTIYSITNNLKHVSTGGLPDTMYTVSTNASGDILYKLFTAYTYDSYDEPTLGLGYSYHIDTSGVGSYDTTVDKISNYYYELYTARHANPNGVPTIPPTAENMTIYPNPASNEVNISRPGVAAGTYTYVQLINAAGQTVRTESLPWLQETETVSMAGLTPGMYWVVVQDRGGSSVWKQAVVKE